MIKGPHGRRGTDHGNPRPGRPDTSRDRHPVQSGEREVPAPGDLYVFDAGEDVGLQWLVVRFHPDDPKMLLLAPADDFPLTGTPDLSLPHEVLGRPITIRCGETDWFPATFCSPRLRSGTVPDAALGLVRRRLAEFARGRATATPNASVDLDPEYEEWIDEVSHARLSLLARAEASQPTATDVVSRVLLSTAPPAPLVAAPEFSLAAEAGGAFAELGKALAGSDDARYHEVSAVPGGRLFLVTDAHGVRGVWEGAFDRVPVVLHVRGSGDEVPLTWHSGPEGRLHKTHLSAPWLDGRVVLAIGTSPRRTVAVDL